MDDRTEGRHDKRSSRVRFREFLRERGFFGHRKTAAEIQEEEESNRTSADGKEGETAKTRPPRQAYLVRYFRLLRRHHARIGLLLILSVFGHLLSAALPWSGKILIDHVFPQRDLSLLLTAGGWLLGIGVLWTLLSLTRDYLSRCLRGNIITTVRRRVMKHLQQMSLARLQEMKVGGVVTRLQADTEQLAGLLHHGLLTPFNAIVMLAIGVGSLLLLSWKVTLVCLAFCLAVILAAYGFFSIMRPFQRALRKELAAIGGRLTETFGGIQVVRAFWRARAETAAYTREIHLLWRKQLHVGVFNIILHQAIRFVYVLIYIAVWVVGGYYLLRKEMQVGDLVTFTLFIDWLFGPIFMIMSSFAEMQTSYACTERIFDLLDEPREMPDRPGAVKFTQLEDGLRLEDVTFDYPDGTRALNHVNVEIPRGKVTALVGPSGAGKSTNTNLVMRFYDVTAGRLSADGRDIRDLTLASYRRRLGLVLQDVFLFDGTIRENIAYGKPQAALTEIEAAAEIANCHEFIGALEEGYDAIIGERGIKLSGGQKQRLALARALLTDPQILILDEATSSLDSESEALIQEALHRIFENRTTLVIAHRLSTVMDADKIVVIEKGEIQEEGTHQSLLDRRGRYYELYTKQMEKAQRQRTYLDWDTEEGVGGEAD